LGLLPILSFTHHIETGTQLKVAPVSQLARWPVDVMKIKLRQFPFLTGLTG
jgi:hypothetical protein